MKLVPLKQEQKSQLSSSEVASSEKLQAKGSLQIWAEKSEKLKVKNRLSNSMRLLNLCETADFLMGNDIKYNSKFN